MCQCYNDPSAHINVLFPPEDKAAAERADKEKVTKEKNAKQEKIDKEKSIKEKETKVKEIAKKEKEKKEREAKERVEKERLAKIPKPPAPPPQVSGPPFDPKAYKNRKEGKPVLQEQSQGTEHDLIQKMKGHPMPSDSEFIKMGGQKSFCQCSTGMKGARIKIQGYSSSVPWWVTVENMKRLCVAAGAAAFSQKPAKGKNDGTSGLSSPVRSRGKVWWERRCL